MVQHIGLTTAAFSSYLILYKEDNYYYSMINSIFK